MIGIELATFRLVAQCLNQLRYYVTPSILRLPRNLRKKKKREGLGEGKRRKFPQIRTQCSLLLIQSAEYAGFANALNTSSSSS